MIKAIFFDFDGTLLNSLKPNMLAFSYAFKAFGKNINYKKITRFFGESPEVIVRYFFPGKDKLTIKKIVNLKDNSYSKKFIKKSKLFPGVISLLKSLNKKKIKTCLISHTPRKFLLKHLKRFKLKKYFSSIVGNDEVKCRERWAMLLKACKNLKLKQNQVVYIADSVYDAKAAKKAKIRFFGVATGSYSRKELLKCSENVFKNITEVNFYIKKLI